VSFRGGAGELWRSTGGTRRCLQQSAGRRNPSTPTGQHRSRCPRTSRGDQSGLAHGVHPRDLCAARDSGTLIELSRGVFRHTEASLATYPGFLAVAHRAPRAVVCLVSAAAVHDLTDEIPAVVQVSRPL
jgi:hypothetical protein